MQLTREIKIKILKTSFIYRIGIMLWKYIYNALKLVLSLYRIMANNVCQY